ncbi:MAG: hypothetical protein D6828_06815 [Nitrospirae bacterium]|nr:MAG: hypothetical protein D6828_06815 [Nitrospirota bacterium]
MDIEISYKGDSHHIEVENPYKMDAKAVSKEMEEFLNQHGLKKDEIKDLNIAELLPKMVRGVAGCEAGCPANAYSLVKSGVGSYKLKYIDGGILTAYTPVKDGTIEIKVFPGF